MWYQIPKELIVGLKDCSGCECIFTTRFAFVSAAFAIFCKNTELESRYGAGVRFCDPATSTASKFFISERSLDRRLTRNKIVRQHVGYDLDLRCKFKWNLKSAGKSQLDEKPGPTFCGLWDSRNVVSSR
jgi:hypothetical protein